MIVSLAQPYFFPYIGYFQLIAASDVFVIYDDAQYMKNGWVNRNRILGKTGPVWFTFPVKHAAHTLAINQRRYAREGHRSSNMLLTTLAHRYARAPNFEPTMSLVESIFSYPESNVAAFNSHLIKSVCKFLDIGTRIEIATSLRTKQSDGVQAVIDICHLLGAEHYLNPSGGTDLYSRSTFFENGLTLGFINPQLDAYRQFEEPAQLGLSIIDVLMFNENTLVRDMLGHRSIVQA